MKHKYYLSGEEITQSEKDKLLSGKSDKTVYSPKGQPGIPFAVTGAIFKTKGKTLDISDQFLRECLDKVGIDIKKTFIVQDFIDNENQGGSIYGCW